MKPFLAGPCWNCGLPYAEDVNATSARCTQCGRWLFGTGTPPRLYVLEYEDGLFGGTMWEPPPDDLVVDGKALRLARAVAAPPEAAQFVRHPVDDAEEWQALLDKMRVLGWKTHERLAKLPAREPSGTYEDGFDPNRSADLAYKRDLLRVAFKAGFAARDQRRVPSVVPDRKQAPYVALSEWSTDGRIRFGRMGEPFVPDVPVSSSTRLALTDRHAVFSLPLLSKATFQLDLQTGDWHLTPEGEHEPIGAGQVLGTRVGWGYLLGIARKRLVRQSVWDTQRREWLAGELVPELGFLVAQDKGVCAFDLGSRKTRTLASRAGFRTSADGRFAAVWPEQGPTEFSVIDLAAGKVVARHELRVADRPPEAFAVTGGEVLWYAAGTLSLGARAVAELSIPEAQPFEFLAAFDPGATRLALLTDEKLRLFELGKGGRVRRATAVELSPLRPLVVDDVTVKFRSRVKEGPASGRLELVREDTAAVVAAAKAEAGRHLLAGPVVAISENAKRALCKKYGVIGGDPAWSSWEAPLRVRFSDGVVLRLGRTLDDRWWVMGCSDEKALARARKEVAPHMANGAPKVGTVTFALFAPKYFDVAGAIRKLPAAARHGYYVGNPAFGAALALKTPEQAAALVAAVRKYGPEELGTLKQILSSRGIEPAGESSPKRRAAR